MITIKTKVGILYMEEENRREESDRIKLYDSNSRYFDYLPLESIKPKEIGSYCKTVVEQLEKMETIEKILSFLWIEAYTFSESWIDLLEDIFGLDGYEYDLDADKYIRLFDGSEITEASLLENEYVNKIGDTYILVCE